MKNAHKRLTMMLAGAAVTLAAVVYFLAQLSAQWEAVREAFAQANYWFVLPSTAALVFFYGFRVLRWRIFLRPIREVPYATLTSATLIGFMANCVLPLRAGEIIRPYVVHRKGGVTFGEAAGTAMGLERVFDLIGVAALLLATWLALAVEIETPAAGPPPPAPPAGAAGADTAIDTGVSEGPVADAAPSDATADETPPADAASRRMELADVWKYSIGFVVLAAVGMAGLVLLAFAPKPMLRTAAFVLRPLPESVRHPLTGFLESLARSMVFVRSPAQVGIGILLTLGQWAGIVLSTYLLSLGFDMELTLGGVLLIQLTTTVAVALPQAPAYFAMFQIGAATGAAVFGIAEGEAMAFANMLWAVNVVPITVVGLVFLQKEGLSLARLARESEGALAAQADGDAARE